MSKVASPFLSGDVHSDRRWCSEDVCDQWQESLENEFQGGAASLHVTEKQTENRVPLEFHSCPPGTQPSLASSRWG